MRNKRCPKNANIMTLKACQLLLTGVLLLCNQIIKAQNYPSFTAQVFDSTSSGYYFTSVNKFGSPTYPQTQFILDGQGNVVFYNSVFSSDYKIQDNGMISYSNASKFYLLDSTFMKRDSVRCKNGIQHDGHDLQILPNGHYLLLGMENVTMDLSGYNLFSGNGSPGSTTANVKAGVIQEQDATKQVVFEWHAKDHFSFADVDVARLFGPANVDWTHCNAVELDTDGNLLLSSRHFNEITKINRNTGAVMWRLGGNANQFTFINDSLKFAGQHDIRRLANGNISLFDNGKNGVPMHPAAAKEYQIDEQNLTATLVWSYVNNPLTNSTAMGNAQRLVNGNTLVNYGNVVDGDVVFNLVKPSGAKVFELRFDDSLAAYRSYAYPSLPWNLNRPVITCAQNGANYYLDAGSGHASYIWNTGATTQQIQVTDTGKYWVFVPKGVGGFISSEAVTVSNLVNPCGTLTGIANVEPIHPFELIPNPVQDKLTLQFTNTHALADKVFIYNSNGDCVAATHTDVANELSLDVSTYKPGVYCIRYKEFSKKWIKL
ncbi:MAG: aryl-sulfate sulfotransferase [Bacteroidetes bacterium]|nr:aryl-sulfate sulfotransferase [Bacteroidota bacterium]